MKHEVSVWLVAAAVLTGAGPARAEDPGVQDVGLDKIVVSSSRVEENANGISRSVDVVGAADIEKSGASAPGQVLTGLTGVNFSDYGGRGASKTVRMRGSTAAQVLVMVDGRPINSPRDGEADLSVIPLADVKRIEVMHGPASSLYGAGAMGGTVNIITRKPPKDKMLTELTSTFGTWRSAAQRLVHGARVRKFGYLVTGGYETSEGFRDNGEFRGKNASAKFDYEISDEHTVGLKTDFMRSLSGAPGLLSSPDIDDKQRNLKNSQEAFWEFKSSGGTDVSVRNYSSYDRLEFIENTAGSIFDTALNKDIHTTRVRGLDAQASREFSSFYRLVGGFSYAGNENDSSTSAKHEYNVRGVFLDNCISPFEPLAVNLGARLDDYSNFGTQINPSASARYQFNDDIKARASVSRSFRAPTFNDLYWPDQGWVRGNSELAPEKGITAEAGVDARWNKYLSSGITYYHSDFDRLIQWAESSGVWSPTNIGSARMDGVEFEQRVSLSEHFEACFGYTWLRARDKNEHSYLIYQPKHKVDASLKYKHNGFEAGVNGQFTDKRFHDALSTIQVKRFYVLGLDVSQKFGDHTTGFIWVDNLLNNTYEVIRDYPMPGLSVTGGVKVEF